MVLDVELDRDGGIGAPNSDSAVQDAESADAADAAAAMRCEDLYPAAIFCDDFEGPDLSRWDGTRGDVALVESPVQRGMGAARAVATAESSIASLDQASLPQISSGDLFVRAYFWVPAEAPAEGMTILHVEEPGDPWGYAEVALIDGMFSLRTGTSIHTAPTGATFGGAVPRDRWVCIELRVVVADIGGAVELYVDELRTAQIAGVDTLPSLPYETLYAAISETTSGVQTFPTELVLDEVVVARASIGCEPP